MKITILAIAMGLTGLLSVLAMPEDGLSVYAAREGVPGRRMGGGTK